MAEARKIGGGFIQKQVKVDGNTWTYREIGSGESQRLMQAFARVKLYAKRAEQIDNRILDGTSTDEDLDKQEEYLDKIEKCSNEANEILFACLTDGTKDNASVREWFDKTPQWKIERTTKDILKGDSESKEKEEADAGQPKGTAEEAKKEDSQSS